MKKLVLFAALAACTPKYDLEIRATSTPPLQFVASPLTIFEGTAVNTRVALYENDEVKDVDEDDFELYVRDVEIATVLPGPKRFEIALLGLSPGETTLYVRYKNKVVEEKFVRVLAQE